MGEGAIVGVSDHGGWAVLVTVAGDGSLLDRRRVELVGEGLPKLPHHHESQRLPLQEALALLERVRASAERQAAVVLESVADAVTPTIVGIALRECQSLPATVAERLSDYRARNVADWVMYREALAGAARARDWSVHWFDSRTVFDLAREALNVEDLNAYFQNVRRSAGPPWGRDQKLAMAAAVTAARAASV